MEQRNPRLRWLLIWGVAVVWIVAVLARLSYLQLFSYSEYLSKAQRQQQRIFEISPKRGTIYDRKGRELAVSLPVDSLFADPAEISDASTVSHLLSRVLDTPANDIQTKIDGAHTPVRLARKLSPEIVKRIDDMNLKGVFFQKENRRLYPERELAASVLGYVDVDEKGIGGIEYSLDKQIRGRPGKMMVTADGKRRWYDRREAAADPGDSVTLTIDQTIQYIAEKELANAIATTHAKAGTVVVQDPNTGELLAVANWPVFDPNDAGSYSPDSRIDRAVSSAYEPGSTFKVITLTAAIENGVATPDEMINCQMGTIMVAGRLIHDWHPFGMLSVRQILEHSSDVGSIKVALQLGSPKFYDVIRQFGIGQPTGIELPGENRGLLRPLSGWTPSSIGSLAMGQEVSVTPIQIISAISAVANGGTLYSPRIVRDVTGPQPEAQISGANPRQVTDGKTAAQMREMMEGVVLEGTGKPAALEGYTAAGKSGTAQKIDPATGRYSKTQYNSSFVGFAPVNNPAITILVVLDSPVGAHHGGEVGGPVFKAVAQQVLAYMNEPRDVPSDIELAQAKKPGTKANTNAAAVAQVPPPADDSEAKFHAAMADAGARNVATSVAVSDQDLVTVPDFSRESVRAATEESLSAGVTPALIGTGIVLEQFPEAGARVARGSKVTMRFGRAGELVPIAVRKGQN